MTTTWEWCAPSVTSHSLVIDGGTLLAVGTLTLAATCGIWLGGNGTSGEIDVASGQMLTYGGTIADNPSSGGDQLTVGNAAGQNTGTLVLSGANTYSGGTTVDASLVYQIASGVTLTLAYPIGGSGSLRSRGRARRMSRPQIAWRPPDRSLTTPRSCSISRPTVPSTWQAR